LAAVAQPAPGMASNVLWKHGVVQLLVRLTATPDRLAELVKAMRVVMLPARMERGCTSTQLSADVERPDALCYREEWLTERDIDRQICSDRFARLLELMETAAEPPVLEFRFVSATRGLDYVAALRGADNGDDGP
jgi:quinol monooxygenase YgiN